VDVDDDDLLIQTLISTAREYCEGYTSQGFMPQQWTMTMDHFPFAADLDGAPSRAQYGIYGGYGNPDVYLWAYTQTIALPRSPLLSVDSFQYYDTGNVLQTIDPSAYYLDTTSETPRIVPADGTVWPLTYLRPNAVSITFTVGWQQQAVDVLTPSGSPPSVTITRQSSFISVVSVATTATGVLINGWTNNGPVITLPLGSTDDPVTVTYLVTAVPAKVQWAMLLLVGAYYANRSEFTVGEGAAVSIPMGVHSLLSEYRTQVFGYPGSGL
jgi:hypothetical protein